MITLISFIDEANTNNVADFSYNVLTYGWCRSIFSILSSHVDNLRHLAECSRCSKMNKIDVKLTWVVTLFYIFALRPLTRFFHLQLFERSLRSSV